MKYPPGALHIVNILVILSLRLRLVQRWVQREVLIMICPLTYAAQLRPLFNLTARGLIDLVLQGLFPQILVEARRLNKIVNSKVKYDQRRRSP